MNYGCVWVYIVEARPQFTQPPLLRRAEVLLRDFKELVLVHPPVAALVQRLHQLLEGPKFIDQNLLDRVEELLRGAADDRQ